jgi:hypothetical protein
MVSLAEEGEQKRAHGGHAGAEANRADALLQGGDLDLHGGHGGVGLTGVGVALLAVLEDGGQILGPFVAVGNGGVDRLVEGAVLGSAAPVGMQERRGDAGDALFFGIRFHCFPVLVRDLKMH